MITRFPHNGRGMKVWRKTWDESNYFLVKHVEMSTKKSARMYGLKFQNNELVGNKVERIRGVTKRGIWQFDYNEAFEVPEFVEEEAASQDTQEVEGEEAKIEE